MPKCTIIRLLKSGPIDGRSSWHSPNKRLKCGYFSGIFMHKMPPSLGERGTSFHPVQGSWKAAPYFRRLDSTPIQWVAHAQANQSLPHERFREAMLPSEKWRQPILAWIQRTFCDSFVMCTLRLRRLAAVAIPDTAWCVLFWPVCACGRFVRICLLVCLFIYLNIYVHACKRTCLIPIAQTTTCRFALNTFKPSEMKMWSEVSEANLDFGSPRKPFLPNTLWAFSRIRDGC